jgi:hypothetical protein
MRAVRPFLSLSEYCEHTSPLPGARRRLRFAAASSALLGKSCQLTTSLSPVLAVPSSKVLVWVHKHIRPTGSSASVFSHKAGRYGYDELNGKVVR